VPQMKAVEEGKRGGSIFRQEGPGEKNPDYGSKRGCTLGRAEPLKGRKKNGASDAGNEERAKETRSVMSKVGIRKEKGRH